MCGIAGIYRFDGKPVADIELQQMCHLLHHRGPDDRGWMRRGSVGLANTRLSILDLSPNGHQPIWNEDRSVAVVLNGEIYNFRKLRADLLKRGHRFVSHSDTEVIVHLYEEFGSDCVAKLDGMFALAIWDDRNARLLLARDRTGKKPLFYYISEKQIVFGSEIKALFAAADVPREVCDEYLPEFLALGYVPSPRTLYRNICQLDPATVLSVEQDGSQAFSKYWNLKFSPKRISLARAKEELKYLLKAAVERRLVADVPVGAFLSGGIDSSVVVALMSELCDQPVHTFCVGFAAGAEWDERRYARLVAGRYQTEHRECVVGPQSVELLEALVKYHDQPFVDSSAIPTYLVSKFAREHVTVALTGDGGDELFAGYQRFRAALMSERIPDFWLRMGAKLAPFVKLVSPEHARKLMRICAANGVTASLRLWSLFPLFSAGLWKSSNSSADSGSLSAILSSREELYRTADAGTDLGRLLYCNFHDYLLNDLHVKVDRCSMANSLEARSPFMDTAVIEFAAGLPDDLKLRGATTKYILRETFRNDLPPEIYSRGKKGFGVPLSTWLSDLEPFLRDVLNSSNALVYNYLDRGRIAKLIDEFLQGEELWADAIWTLLTLEIWLRLESQSRANKEYDLASA
jgi:asparagine synthase (glutamine-hydrolysing)